MKILVTGSKGQVGSKVVKLAKSNGYEVYPLDRYQLDITKREDVFSFIEQKKPEIVINAAAYTAVDQAEKESDLAFAVNRDGPAFLAEICDLQKIPLFHISTDYVYDGRKNDAYVEDDIPNPINVYGKSKYAGDREVEKIKQFLILRVAWVFDADGYNFVKTMMRLGKEKDELSIVNDQYGAPTWSADIAQVLLSLIKIYQDRHDLPWGVYHFTGKPYLSWYEFAEEIFNQASSLELLTTTPKLNPIPSEQYPTPAPRPKNSVLSCEKINTVLNISQPDWHLGLKQVLETWKNQ